MSENSKTSPHVGGCTGDPANVLTQFGIDEGPASFGSCGASGPESAVSANRARFAAGRNKPNAPTRPQAREPRPEHPVARLDPKSARSASVVDSELVAPRNDLQLKPEPPVERGDEELHQCNAGCSHGSVIDESVPEQDRRPCFGAQVPVGGRRGAAGKSLKSNVFEFSGRTGLDHRILCCSGH